MSMNTTFNSWDKLINYLLMDVEYPQCFTVNFLPDTDSYELWIGNQPYYTYDKLIELEEEENKNLKYKIKQDSIENELIISKLADIRDLFDESDMAAEGHGMEDAVGQPYAVACYAENKMKRLIEENNNLQEENLLLYGKLNMITDIIEKGRRINE